MPKKILLQTTIPAIADDWNIARFHLLAEFLDRQQSADGSRLFQVTARNRDTKIGPDSLLSRLDQSDVDQLWLFAVDTGDGLTPEDAEGIARFHRRGGGMLVTRDHMDLGSSVCRLDCRPAAAHRFHSRNEEPDPSRRCIDDPYTPAILWPNYHSGANGDFQRVRVVGAPHPVLRDPLSPDGLVSYLPSHPHEGSVVAPADDAGARVILAGRSAVTGRAFNLAVAFEPSAAGGPAIAQSTFHHFSDYNWHPAAGAPSFVGEPPGDGMARLPEALRSTQRYVRNVALWLAGQWPA